MKAIIINPVTIWLKWLLKKAFLEFVHRKKHLRLGYMANACNCKFGIFNTIYPYVKMRNVEIGDFSYVSSNSQISRTKIGKFCSVGPNVICGLGKHPTNKFVSTYPAFFSALKHTQVTFAEKDFFKELDDIYIGNDAWIGNRAIILSGVRIGDGAIIGAGAIVTKDVPPYAIAVGTPARITRCRFSQADIDFLLDFKWWDRDLNWLRDNYKLFHNIEELKKLR
jgi:acetyltransferase-like isoleucine patch superfamily enzyme